LSRVSACKECLVYWSAVADLFICLEPRHSLVGWFPAAGPVVHPGCNLLAMLRNAYKAIPRLKAAHWILAVVAAVVMLCVVSMVPG